MSSSSNREACAAAIGKERCVWKTSNQVRDRDPQDPWLWWRAAPVGDIRPMWDLGSGFRH